MRPGTRAFWLASRLLGFACLLLCMTQARAAGGNVLHFDRAEILIAGTGTFAAPPPTVDEAALPGSWSPVSLPHALARDINPANGAGTGIVTTWYRVHIAGLEPAAKGSTYLFMPRWQTIGRIAVYGDGKLLFRSRGGPVWNGFNHPLWIPLDEQADSGLPGTVLIRMDSLRSAGGAISSFDIGDEEALAWRKRMREWLQADLPFLSSGAFLAVGLFALGVWAMRRRETIYLLFFGSSVLFYVRCMHYYLGLEPLPIPEDWFGWLTVNSLGWLVVNVYFFTFMLAERRYRRLERWLVGLMLFASAATLPLTDVLPNLALLAPLAYLILLGITVAASVAGFWVSRQVGSRDGMLLSVWNGLTIPCGMHDWMLQNYLIGVDGYYLLPYTCIGTFAIFMVVMYRRYIGAIDQVEKLNMGLEQRLSEREAELTLSHNRLREVEQREMLSQERQRLMQDMHDGLGSSLMSALKVVERGRLGEVQVAQVLRECIDDLKLAIDSLEPVEADLLLLLATLRFRLGPRLESTGIALRWEVRDVPTLDWLDPRSALHILRILQEVFTNVIKHTQAGEIRVATSFEGDAVLVSVQDDGQGFDADAALKGGNGKGLHNLLRRSEAIGARVSWEPAARGTLFRLWLPLRRPATPVTLP
ncbi:MAG: ATP-binding protein [Pseudomonadota bacterium]